MIEQTLVLIKPDGVLRQLTGKILTRFEDAGFKVVGMKMVWIDEEFSKKHYAEHVEKPFYKGLESLITMGPVVAMILEGVNCIENIRKMVGATEPKSAAPGTIRGDFTHVSYGYADSQGIGVKNVVHASADKNDASKEIPLWFEKDEIHSYDSVHDVHLLK